MTQHSPPESQTSRQRLMDELEALRNNARLQAHLLSMDARTRWNRLEERLNGAEQLIGASAHGAGESVREKLTELTRAVQDLFRSEALQGPELSVPVSSAMTPSPVSCSVQDTLNRTAQLMWDRRVGVLAVVDDAGSVVGMVTDRDVAMGAYTQGRRLDDIAVSSVMSRQVHLCCSSDSLGVALGIMSEHGVRRLPVVNDGQLVGIVSVADVIRAVYRKTGGLQPAAAALAQMLDRDASTN